VICYLLRHHIFVPDDVGPDDERFPFLVLMMQIRYFGPVPNGFFELLDDEAAELLRYLINQQDGEEGGDSMGLFSKAGLDKISVEDREFVCFLMRLDPRDRPSAEMALAHPWLSEKGASPLFGSLY
jgi:casein kinase II subunit alpha